MCYPHRNIYSAWIWNCKYSYIHFTSVQCCVNKTRGLLHYRNNHCYSIFCLLVTMTSLPFQDCFYSNTIWNLQIWKICLKSLLPLATSTYFLERGAICYVFNGVASRKRFRILRQRSRIWIPKICTQENLTFGILSKLEIIFFLNQCVFWKRDFNATWQR